MLNPVFFVVLKGNIPELHDVSIVTKRSAKANSRCKAVFLYLLCLAGKGMRGMVLCFEFRKRNKCGCRRFYPSNGLASTFKQSFAGHTQRNGPKIFCGAIKDYLYTLDIFRCSDSISESALKTSWFLGSGALLAAS